MRRQTSEPRNIMSTEAKPETDTTPDLPDAKPPFLKRVRIRNYKSIAFCDVSLEPLTILVGRNASGKSNFLDALGFLADLMDMKVTDAVGEHGGWRSVLSRSATSPYIEFAVDASLSLGGSHPIWDADYAFVLEEGTSHQIRVCWERLILREHGAEGYEGFEYRDGKLTWFGRAQPLIDIQKYASLEDIVHASSNGIAPLEFHPKHPLDRVILSSMGNQLTEEFRASAVYNFSPPAIRQIKLLTASTGLAHDGSNLAHSIAALREIDPSEVERVGQSLTAIVPEIVAFETIPYGTEDETIQFSVVAHPGADPQQFLARNMSDGTLRVLAALIASRQIYLPTNASGFIGIEEPETALHPDAMMALVEALDEATLIKQILLTTHSPDLLDVYSIKPENVRVVEMIDGETVIGGVDEASLEIIKRKLDTLGGRERQKQLEPNREDVERQKRLACNGQRQPA